MGGFILDFLCIHPFRDGNGRVSRLLMLLLCYYAGAEVGRYISIERLIEENKQRYYETLELSSKDWHEGKHNPWPFINFVLWILKEASKEFEVKWDGTRALAFVDSPGSFRLINRRRVDLNGRYPDLSFLGDLPPGTVVDGEIVVLKSGKPEFQCLQSREQARAPLYIKSLAQ